MAVENVWSGLYVPLLGVLLLCQLALWAVLYQVVKQQGRILLRLDEVGSASAKPTELPVLHAPPPVGPKIGDTVAPFRLPSTAGHDVSLQDFQGKQVLLVNWSPGCGFCDMIAAELAEHQTGLLERDVHLVLVSRGDAVANLRLAQEHGLNGLILIQADGETLPVFRNQGTPVACLVDKDGRVARPLVVGANEVPQLVRELATSEVGKRGLPGERPLSESHIVRDGLKAGTPAPSFTLPDVCLI